MASTVSQGESSSTGPSHSSPNNNITTPDHDDSSWPIAFRKGTQSTRKPIYNFLNYHKFSPAYFSFISSVSSIIIPKNVTKALDYLG